MSQKCMVSMLLCCTIFTAVLMLQCSSSDINPAPERISRFVPIWLPRLPAIPAYQNLTFKAIGITFNLGLNPKWSVITIATDITIIRWNGTEQVDGSRFSKWYYGGLVNDSADSVIHGTLENGIFDGYFQVDSVTYFIEPCWKYFMTPTERFNAVLYTSADNQTCLDPKSKCVKDRGHFGKRDNETTTTDKRLHQEDTLLRTIKDPASVKKAALKQKPEPLICTVKIVGDFRFSTTVKSGYKMQTLEYIKSIMSKVDNIFRKVDFDGDGQPENIGFYVTKIEIYLDPVHKDLVGNDTWDPVAFFEEMQHYDFNDTCAGLLFTHRQMDPSTQIWGPSLFKSNAVNESQGICSSVRPAIPQGPEDDYGRYFSNALPVNFRWKRGTVSETTMVVQVLHQLGHLFGAWDDQMFNDTRCNTTSHPLRFISSFPPPSGHYPNNLLFSPCSKYVMKVVLKSSQRPCLKTCHDPVVCDRVLELPLPNIVSFRALKHTTETKTMRCVTIPKDNCQRPISVLYRVCAAALLINYVLGLQKAP